MLYKIAINNSIHIPFLRKYFGFSFFNALPPPPPVLQGGTNLFRVGQSLRDGQCPPPERLRGGTTPFAPPFVRHCSGVISIDLGIESFSPVKKPRNEWCTCTPFLTSTYMESFHNAPIIHVLNLAWKRFLQPVNSQKPCTEWSTCTPFRHIPHSKSVVASKGMDRLSNGQKDFCNKL